MKIRAIVKPNAKNRAIRHGQIREETVIPGETWQIIVYEPAIDDRANTRAIALLAAHFNVPKTHVKLTNGATSRYKTFEIDTFNT